MAKKIFLISALATLFAFFVIGLGAYTRLANAGLGCPDWPTCYGHLWVPTSSADIAVANEKFAQTPVETQKTWPEQLHRICATTLGILILIIFFLSNRRYCQMTSRAQWNSVSILLCVLILGVICRVFVGAKLEPVLGLLAFLYFANLLRLSWISPRSPTPWKLPALIAGLVIMQGLFGMWTVTLKLWPQVVSTHLLGGFATFALLFLLSVRLSGISIAPASPHPWIRPLSKILLLLVIVQLMLGGWTTSNYAALACTDFPTCNGQWVPHMDFAHGFNFTQHIGPNYLGGNLRNEGRVAIHFSHRLGAALVFLCTLALIIASLAKGDRGEKRIAGVIAATVALQITLGIANVKLLLPLPNAVAHNLVGSLLLLCVIFCNYYQYRRTVHHDA